MSVEYDLVVIGAGSGGVRAARFAAQYGARVAIVEERFFGGTCVNVGCVPKKLLAYAAGFPEDIALARDFGYDTRVPDVDWERLRGAKDREIERLNDIYRNLLTGSGVAIYEGHGRVEASGVVLVDDQRLNCRHILVATGGKPWVPDFPGRELVNVSDDLFYLDALPSTVAVVGGGYIACEFASILQGLGCEVHLIYRRPLFLRGFDNDIRQFVAEAMDQSCMNLHFSTDVDEVSAHGGGYRLQLGQGEPLDVDRVFYATGRTPLVDSLFSDELTVDKSASGALRVNEHGETSVPGLYAIGDVTDRVQLTPVALEEGMWLARHLYGPDAPEPLDYAVIPSAVFCTPNIATVGLTQEEALARHGRVRVYKARFRPMRYSLGTRSSRILQKLIVDDATDQVLGLHMAGEEAAEIVQGFAVAVRTGVTKKDFDRTVAIHPTSAEEFVTMRDGEVIEQS